jgi:hypothetical protein
VRRCQPLGLSLKDGSESNASARKKRSGSNAPALDSVSSSIDHPHRSR